MSDHDATDATLSEVSCQSYREIVRERNGYRDSALQCDRVTNAQFTRPTGTDSKNTPVENTSERVSQQVSFHVAPTREQLTTLQRRPRARSVDQLGNGSERPATRLLQVSRLHVPRGAASKEVPQRPEAQRQRAKEERQLNSNFNTNSHCSKKRPPAAASHSVAATQPARRCSTCSLLPDDGHDEVGRRHGAQ